MPKLAFELVPAVDEEMVKFASEYDDLLEE